MNLKSKLGFHIDIAAHNGELEKIIDCRPAIIKVISALGIVNTLHDALPQTVFIARDWDVSDDFTRFIGSQTPEQAAQRWLDELSDKIEQVPFCYWESFNEMSNWDILDRYADFEAERIRLMYREGWRACIGNFATGTPAISENPEDTREDIWDRFYPALAAANAYNSLVGLHEYGGLWMDLWYGPNQHNELIAGQRVELPSQRKEGWLFGRYRKVWRRHCVPNGWMNVRFAITELGLDMAGTYTTDILLNQVGLSGPAGAWKTLGEPWKRISGVTDPNAEYIKQLIWTDIQMQYDPFMVGGTIFTWGTLSNFWDNWEIEGTVADVLCDHIKDPEEVRLVVPYISQREPGATYSPNDCGPTCVAMIVGSRGVNVTPDQIYQDTYLSGSGLISVTDLQNVSAMYGVPMQRKNGYDLNGLRVSLDEGKPAILLIDYAPVMRAGLNESPINVLHFVVVVGYNDRGFLIHDPYWRGTGGAYREWPDEVVSAAWIPQGGIALLTEE